MFKFLLRTAVVAVAALGFPGLAMAQSCPGLNTNVAGFSNTGAALISATTTSSSVALPSPASSSPASSKVVVTNTGTSLVFVQLGDGSVTASASTGYAILPSSAATLAINSSTYIAAVSLSGTVGVRINTGY